MDQQVAWGVSAKVECVYVDHTKSIIAGEWSLT